MRAHQAVAFRMAFTITGDAAEAEDAAQEAFMKVYRTLDRFRSGSPFRPWLLTVVANEARNRRRAAGRRLGLTIRAAELRVPADATPGRATVRATFGQRPPEDAYGRQSAEARFFVTG